MFNMRIRGSKSHTALLKIDVRSAPVRGVCVSAWGLFITASIMYITLTS